MFAMKQVKLDQIGYSDVSYETCQLIIVLCLIVLYAVVHVVTSFVVSNCLLCSSRSSLSITLCWHVPD